MKVFVAGASGVIGRALVPLLVQEGHLVTAMTRSPQRTTALSAAGATPVVCDALDGGALTAAIGEATPDAVVHELTSLPKAINPRTALRDLASNDRLRVEGTRNLVAAARAAGARRIVAQSIAFAYAPGPGLRDEDDPLYLDAPAEFRRSVDAVATLEQAVTGAGGVVLRYGYLYGPGSSYAHDGSLAELVRRRRFPVVGSGDGIFSFVHVDDAVRATVRALDHAAPTIFNIVDDEPAAAREWLPVYAAALGARPPRRVPAWLVRGFAGSYAAQMMTSWPGASNARARERLGWRPAIASWREGFRSALG